MIISRFQVHPFGSAILGGLGSNTPFGGNKGKVRLIKRAKLKTPFGGTTLNQLKKAGTFVF